jgi:hypothetical protein
MERQHSEILPAALEEESMMVDWDPIRCLVFGIVRPRVRKRTEKSSRNCSLKEIATIAQQLHIYCTNRLLNKNNFVYIATTMK